VGEGRLKMSSNPGLMPDRYGYSLAALRAAILNEGQASCG
jgi:hypothetical protein